MSKRVSPAERLRVQIDEVFAGGQDLARAIEETAQLGAQLLLQCAVEAEVAAFLGRNRYARVAGTEAGTQERLVSCSSARLGVSAAATTHAGNALANDLVSGSVHRSARLSLVDRG